MKAEELRAKEEAITAHISNAALDGCMCEPCIACRAIAHEFAAEQLKWKDAVIDAAVVNWTFTKEHEDNPRLAIASLLWQAQKEALDPAISKEADVMRREFAAEQLELAAQETPGILLGVASGLRSRAAELRAVEKESRA